MQKFEFNIRPNLTQNKLEVTFIGDNYTEKTLTVIDKQGIIRKEIKVKNEKTGSIDLHNLAAGVYVLSVKSCDGINCKRFVVTSAK